MYSMKKFSEIVDLPISTIRYYENNNLLNPKRDHHNYRIFYDSDIKWINFIIRLKKIGMPMKKIKLYSDLRKQGNSTIKKRMELLRKQKELLNHKMEMLKSDAYYLDKKLNTYQEMLKNNS